MTLRTRPKELASALARGIDRGVAALGALGPGAYAWPVVIGMGLGVGVLGLYQPQFAHGVVKRRATMEFMKQGLVAVALSTFLVAVTAIVLAFLRRRRDVDASLSASYTLNLRRGAFLTALPFVVALREPLEHRRWWLVLGFVALAAGLVAYSVFYFQSSNVTRGAPSRVWIVAAPTMLGAFVLAYALRESELSLLNHLSFNTGRVDLGVYVSLFRESTEGRLLACSACTSGPNPVSHFEPLLALLSPVYLLHPSAETLFVLQAVWLASGAVPVYLLGRRHVEERGPALALALAYLLYPALHAAGLYGIQSVSFAIPIASWLLLFLEREDRRAYFVALALLLMVREDMPFVAAGVGLYALARGGTRRSLGAITLLAAGLYAGLVAIVARLPPWHVVAQYGGSSLFEVVSGRGRIGHASPLVSFLEPVLEENRVWYVAVLLLPLLGLPLLGRGKLTLVYGALVALLFDQSPIGTLQASSSPLVIPFLFALSASGLARIRRGDFGLVGASRLRLVRALSAAVLVASILCSWKVGALAQNESFQAGPRQIVTEPTPEQIALDSWLQALSKKLPRGAKVAASVRLLPHLGSASHLYLLDDRWRSDYVVAAMKQRAIAKIISSEEAKGYLVAIDSHADVRVYRTKYRGRPPRSRGALEDD